MGEVRAAAFTQAEAELQRNGESKHRMPNGVFGWTAANPNPAPRLDADAVAVEMKLDPELRKRLEKYLIQRQPGKPQFYLR